MCGIRHAWHCPGAAGEPQEAGMESDHIFTMGEKARSADRHLSPIFYE